MKLIWKIVRHFAWIISLAMSLWAVIFYFALMDEINDETEDLKEDYTELLNERLSEEIDYFRHMDEAGNTAGREGTRGNIAEDNGPDFEKDELKTAILTSIIGLYLVLIIIIIVVNLTVLHYNFKPLYSLLDWLKKYKVGASDNPELKIGSDVKEFQQLENAVLDYTHRAEDTLEAQKQFIGNAAHELQTPIAVCKNRIEMLMDDESSLNEKQMGEIVKIYNTLEQMGRLNKSLLLLSRIENNQFQQRTHIVFNTLIRQIADDMSEIYQSRRIEITETGSFEADMDNALAISLVSNLLKNAIVHSETEKPVIVNIEKNTISIRNYGSRPLDSSKIFTRFWHRDNASSSGLGLSIVNAICRLYELNISYTWTDGMNIFEISSKNS